MEAAPPHDATHWTGSRILALITWLRSVSTYSKAGAGHNGRASRRDVRGASTRERKGTPDRARARRGGRGGSPRTEVQVPVVPGAQHVHEADDVRVARQGLEVPDLAVRPPRVDVAAEGLEALLQRDRRAVLSADGPPHDAVRAPPDLHADVVAPQDARIEGDVGHRARERGRGRPRRRGVSAPARPCDVPREGGFLSTPRRKLKTRPARLGFSRRGRIASSRPNSVFRDARRHVRCRHMAPS